MISLIFYHKNMKNNINLIEMYKKVESSLLWDLDADFFFI